jgi:nucleoside-diphosphate-sugar epimerase
MAPILVTGASGFVGQALCRELISREQPVRAIVRDSGSIAIKGCETVKVSSVDENSIWDTALQGTLTVIHLAARVHVMHENASDPLEEFRKVNVAGTEHLARSAAANGVKRFVYVSSIKVNGEGTGGGRKFTETDLPAPQDPYGISKWEAEQALHRVAQETGLEIVIVRPPLVYGDGVKGNFAQMLKVLAKGFPLPLASVHNLRSLIYLENLVDALITCATHPAAAGQTYLVSDGEDISTTDLLFQLGNGMGHPARLIPCPTALLNFAGQLFGKTPQIERLLGSCQVNSDKIRAQLKWTPPFTLQQGLQSTAQRYRTTRT